MKIRAPGAISQLLGCVSPNLRLPSEGSLFPGQGSATRRLGQTFGLSGGCCWLYRRRCKKKSDRGWPVAASLCVDSRGPASETQFQSELELPRVERGGGTAVIAAVARALSESVHIVKERRDRSFVEPIEHVEALCDDIEPHSFVPVNGTADSQVERRELLRYAHITSQSAARKLPVRNHAATTCGSRYTQ